MKKTRFIPFLLLTTLLSGCILPIPHRRLHAYGVRGSVVDSQTRDPIAGAMISRGPDCLGSVESDISGSFEIRPIHGWHGAYFVGPISLSLFPGFDMTAPCVTVSASAPGYQKTIFFLSDMPDWLVRGVEKQDSPVRVNAEFKGPYMESEPLILERLVK